MGERRAQPGTARRTALRQLAFDMRPESERRAEVFAAEIAEEERCVSEMRRLVREGVSDADVERFSEGLDRAEHVLYGWRKAMLVIRRCPQPPDWFRERALAMWTHSGDHIRCEVGDDLLVADALRVLLPGYEGPAMRVWRGESAWNRRRRTYGLSWSKNRHVAEGFARGQQGFYRGGCVVVETDAPPEAVICTVPEDDDGYAEKEVLIDRRWLNGVRVITRYSQRLSSGCSYDR